MRWKFAADDVIEFLEAPNVFIALSYGNLAGTDVNKVIQRLFMMH